MADLLGFNIYTYQTRQKRFRWTIMLPQPLSFPFLDLAQSTTLFSLSRPIQQYNTRKIMIPLLAETFGAERMSYVFFSISQILFPLAFIYANDNKMPAIETSLIRGMVSMVLNFAIVRYYDMSLDYKYDVNFKNMLKRNIIFVFHGLAITASQFYLPLPIVHTINFFAPIFIFVIDYFQNGVRISKNQFYFLIFSVLGLLCTINSDLVNNLLNSDHQIQTEFKNYIKLSPGAFSLYGLGLISIMFLWAYGILRIRTFYKNNHAYVNFHLGLCFTVASGFLYPYQVHRKSSAWTLFFAIFMTGLPLALGQLFFVAALSLNKKTGQLIILTGLPVLVGYLVSYFRYGEMIQSLELIGSTMILVGLMGVIKCGEQPVEVPITSTKLIGDPSKPPTQIMYNVLRMG